MRFQRVHEAVYSHPWFIDSAGYASVRAILDSAMASDQSQAGMLEDFFNERPEMSIDDNGIATIHATGVLGHHLSNIERSCGNTDYAQIMEDFNMAQGANGILFMVDSPGGMVSGCDECAKFIAKVGEETPVVTFSDGRIASAAYYLASGSRWITTTRSAISGSVGVILPWIDQSAMWELKGAKWQPITPDGADLKGVGMGPSLSATGRAHLQELVDEMAGQFREHVLSAREPKDEVWRAGAYGGDKAKKLGIIDQVGSREEAYNKLLKLMR